MCTSWLSLDRTVKVRWHVFVVSACIGVSHLAVTEMLVNVLSIHSEDDEPSEAGGEGGVRVGWM